MSEVRDPRVDNLFKVGLGIFQALILAGVIWIGSSVTTLRQQVAVLQEQQSDIRELKLENKEIRSRLRVVEMGTK